MSKAKLPPFIQFKVSSVFSLWSFMFPSTLINSRFKCGNKEIIGVFHDENEVFLDSGPMRP